MMDWHDKLATDLAGPRPGLAPDATATLEIAFGRARSAIAYALELARAHRLPATGGVTGDSVWLQLGAGRVRFTLNRRVGQVEVLRPGQEEQSFKDDSQDLCALARTAIDALVLAWKQLPPGAQSAGDAAPPYADDEPTKA